MILLQNETITASIHPKGAELQSLQNNITGLEYMWSGDAAYWGKHSPILFPIVGTLANDTYTYNEQEYYLPRHGFAREKIFTAVQTSPTEAWFTLSSSEETLAVYPFEFELQLGYRLIDDKLKCTYRVINNGNDVLWFSVGGHPAFAVPLVAGTEYTDYYLQFNQDEKLERFKLKDGLISDDVEALPIKDAILALQPSLFYEDAIVLKHLASTNVQLLSPQHIHGLAFDFTGFDFLGLWAAKDAPFLCIEPWCGIADNIHHDGNLETKEGIQQIAAGEVWERSWTVKCF